MHQKMSLLSSWWNGGKKTNQTKAKFVTFSVYIFTSDRVKSGHMVLKLKRIYFMWCFSKLNVPCTFRATKLKALWLNSYDLRCRLMPFFIENGLSARKCNVETVDLGSVFFLPNNPDFSLWEGELIDLFTRTGWVKSRSGRLCTGWFIVLPVWSYL